MKLLQETLQRIKKSFLGMQTDERFYIPPPRTSPNVHKWQLSRPSIATVTKNIPPSMKLRV